MCCYIIFCCSCTTAKKIEQISEKPKKEIINKEDFPLLSNAWTGIVFQDLTNDSITYSLNGDKYFRPASNTKILSFYSANRLLKDSLQTYTLYKNEMNQTILKPMADPTYFSDLFEHCGRNNDMSKQSFDFVDISSWTQPKYGNGWMWDDMNGSSVLPFSPAPIYGNVLVISSKFENDQWTYHYNTTKHNYQVVYYDGKYVNANNDTLYLPYQVPIELKSYFPLLNSDKIAISHLGGKKQYNGNMTTHEKRVSNCPLDTVYKTMMYDSDNFLAEYLLLQSGEKLTGKFNSKIAIDTLSKLLFKEKMYPPKWVDGSGLSHYNQINPRFLVDLLRDLWKEKGMAITQYFPAGGKQGTVKNWYSAQPGKYPYIYAKTGTLSNVYCLSGYMIADSGKPYAFSIMVNNFLTSTTTIRKEIQKFLEVLKQK
jgi:serine-type D-Ala-D-Ala carboxypeptidase/endopeptidase (penicillin-binding protein 4)